MMSNYIYIKSDKGFFVQQHNALPHPSIFVLPAKWLKHQAIEMQRYGSEIYQIDYNK